jgi:hypothetical protein
MYTFNTATSKHFLSQPRYNQSAPQHTGRSEETEDGNGVKEKNSVDQYYLPYVQGENVWSCSIHNTIHKYGVISVETRPFIRFMRKALDNVSTRFPRATSEPVVEGQARARAHTYTHTR